MNHVLLQARLEAMIAATPESEIDFIHELSKILEDSFYKAPELIGDSYGRVIWTLERYFGDKPQGWQEKVLEEWLKDVDEVKI